MTAPKFRYLIIKEDDEVYGTNDEDKAAAYGEDLCTVIDVEKMLRCDYFADEEEIEEAPEFCDDEDQSEDPDLDA